MSTSFLAIDEALIGTQVIQRLNDGAIQFTSPDAGGRTVSIRGNEHARMLFRVLTGVLGIASLALTGTQTVAVAATRQFTATATYTGGATRDVTAAANRGVWSSSDTTKATVDQGGLITGVAAGAATITCVYAGKTATRSITVS